MESTTPTESTPIPHLASSASEMARRIADRIVTSVELVQASVDRIEQVHGRINAVAERRFEAALAEAAQADSMVEQNVKLGSLHGVPISIKEMISVAGLTNGWGHTGERPTPAPRDADVVQRIRAAGAIVVATSNVPQLGFFHETDNPVHGRTNHPGDEQRTCGGSSGGDAALIASGCVPLGISTDLGGSIRIPAHFCGVHGLMPTPRSVSTRDIRCLGLGHSLELVAGPMARTVEDLLLGLNAIARQDPFRPFEIKRTKNHFFPCDPRQVDMRRLRVGIWDGDSYFPASPAMRRICQESADHLADLGAAIEPFSCCKLRDIMELYVGLFAADGGDEIRRSLEGSRVDTRLRKVILLSSLWAPIRKTLAMVAGWNGQDIEAHLLSVARRLSVSEFWQLRWRLEKFRADLQRRMEEAQLDAILSPTYGLPAIPHGRSMDLLAAAAYAFFPNLLGYPAGVVSLSRVGQLEQSDRQLTRDRVVQLAAKCEANSTGLPVSVQIIARPWREDVILATLATLESHFQTQADYPMNIGQLGGA